MKCIYPLSEVPSSGVLVIQEGSIIRLFFDFNEDPITMEDDPSTYHECENVDVAGRGYDEIVAGIINDRYSFNDAQAIMANYVLAKDSESDLTEEKRSEYLEEYEAFQAWRAKAKVVAKNVIAGIA
jgi:hypothetical protein